MTELLTVAETAALLKTTKQQVRKMISQQLIPAMKIGREWRVSGQYLEDFCKRTILTRAEQSCGRVPSRDSAVCSFPYMFPVPDCRVPGHQLFQLLMGRRFAQIGQHTQHQQ